MDIRARGLLAEIRKIKGAENSIIAGGAVRDDFLDLKPKDYDFFIPSEGFSGVINSPIFKGIETYVDPKGYESPTLKSVYNIDFEGLKIQLMRMKFPNDESFPTKVVGDFDYGICMAWYEGSSIISDTEQFQRDFKNNTLTLYKLDHLSHLPNAIKRFNYLSDKLGKHWEFRCPLLELKSKSEDIKYDTEREKRRAEAQQWGAVLDQQIEQRDIVDFFNGGVQLDRGGGPMQQMDRDNRQAPGQGVRQEVRGEWQAAVRNVWNAIPR